MKFFCETGSFSEFFEKDDTFATVKVVDTLDARQGMHLLNASNNGTATASDMFVNAIDDYSPQHNDTANKLNDNGNRDSLVRVSSDVMNELLSIALEANYDNSDDFSCSVDFNDECNAQISNSMSHTDTTINYGRHNEYAENVQVACQELEKMNKCNSDSANNTEEIQNNCMDNLYNLDRYNRYGLLEDVNFDGGMLAAMQGNCLVVLDIRGMFIIFAMVKCWWCALLLTLK